MVHHLKNILLTRRVFESDGLIDSQVVDCATHRFTLMIIGPLLESSNSDDELDFHRKPPKKGVTVVTAWPVNHLQSAFLLRLLLDASRLGPSPWGGFKALRGNEEACGSSAVDVWKLLPSATL